ncbi:MAG: PqqD family protein [Candidatus Poribacteria bacterium]|nr:PqqD family protein [Candidatus Poribacteria bacterium]
MINTILYKLRLKKRPDSEFDRERILNALPLRNQLIKWEVDDKEEVSLVIPQQQKLWIRIASKIFSLPDKRVIVLDDVGSFVWRLCDGNNSISQIAKHLSAQYRMTRKEAETSLFTFMRQLGKRNIIGFAVSKKAKGGEK